MALNGTPEKDVKLALAIAAGANGPAAAEQTGIALRTVRRKLATPEFRKLVADLRGELMSRALGRLADNMTRAADAVAGLLDDEDRRIRLRAARTLLTLGVRLRDSVDLNERMSELEDELSAKQGGAS